MKWYFDPFTLISRVFLTEQTKSFVQNNNAIPFPFLRSQGVLLDFSEEDVNRLRKQYEFTVVV
jgi:hypothetical protein